MVKYIIKRIILALVSAFIILSLTFILLKILPFTKPVGTKEVQQAFYDYQVNLGYVIKSQLPLYGYGELLFKSETNWFYYQRPVMDQYFSWLGNILRGNWGVSTSIVQNQSVVDLIKDRIPYTIKINIISVIISVPLGIILGVFAALKKNKPTDHVISTGVMLFISIPSFILITVLMLLFSYKLDWLPSSWPSNIAPLGQKILGYFIPVLALSFGSIAGYARFTRAELCDVMNSEYVLLARTKGLTKRQAICRHALKNAMVPIVPSILAEFIGILSGSMILEKLYNIPGIGNLFVQALNQKDYNVLLCNMAIFTTIGLLAGVIIDISYGFIDPRIRMGAKK